MQNDSNIKFWKLSVAGLIVLNLLILAFVFISHQHQMRHHERFEQMPPPMQGGENPGEFLCRELKFTEKQKADFEILRNQHHEAMDSLEEQSRDLHHDYFDLLNNENPDEQKVTALANEIGQNQKARDLITFHHFETVRKLCNDEQKKHFDDIIHEVLHRIHGGQNQPPPPHP